MTNMMNRMLGKHSRAAQTRMALGRMAVDRIQGSSIWPNLAHSLVEGSGEWALVDQQSIK